MTPLVSVILPTCGRPGLARTLASIRAQAPPATCEIVVIGDTHAGTFAAALGPVPALCAQSAARYLGYDGGLHCVGQPQRQAGMAFARGSWLAFSQDDDVWLPGAWDALRQVALWGPRQPHLFRVETRQAGVVWRERALALGNADADGIVVPNDAARRGQWANVYHGDFLFLQETVAAWGGHLTYAEPVLARWGGMGGLA